MATKTQERLAQQTERLLNSCDHKLGIIHASHESDLFVIIGDGYIVRAWQNRAWNWIIECSFGDEYHSLGEYESQYEALGAMVCKAFSINT